MPRPRSPTLPALLLLLTAAPAGATPLLESHLGGTTLVGPTSQHPSSVFWNPAALAQSEFRGTHIYFGGSAKLDTTTIDRASIDSSTGEPGSDRAFPSVSTNVITPGAMFAFITDAGSERYRFGVSVYSPFAERLPENQDALAYHTRGGSFYTEYATGSLAVRATSQILFGLGVSFVFARFDELWDRDRGLEDCPTPPCAVEDPSLAQRYHVTTDDYSVALSFNLGVLVEVPGIPDLTVGAAYVSFPTLGDLSLARNGDAEVTGLGPGGTGTRAIGDARINFNLPQMLHVGARYKLDPGTDLVFAFRWVDMSTHDDWDVRVTGPSVMAAGIPEWTTRYRGFQDVFSLEGGIERDVSLYLRLAATLRLETSAVQKSRLAADQVDAPKADLALGASFDITNTWRLTAGYSIAGYLPQDVTDSAFQPAAAIDCRQSGFDLDRCEASRQGRGIPTAAGNYNRLSHEVTLGIERHWQ